MNIKDLVVYTGWDLSVGKDVDSGDYTAKLTFGVDKDNNVYIIHVYNERIDFGKRIRKVIEFGRAERPARIAIEDNVFQADTVQVAKSNAEDLNIIGVHTTINKVQKYNEMLVPLCENGKLYLLEGDEMQDKFWQQLCSLPRGGYDDMADAFCIGLKDILIPEEKLSIEFW